MRRVVLEVLLSLLALTCVWWLLRDGEWLTDDLIARIKPGMTLEEVEAILGAPTDVSRYSFAMLSVHPASDGKVRLSFTYRPDDPWLPTYVLTEGEIQKDFLQLSNDVVFWVGRRRVVWVEKTPKVGRIALGTAKRSGGGVMGWLTHQYETWFPRPVATSTVIMPTSLSK